MVKVSESWKQFMASWILPKDKQKISTWGIRVLLGHFFLFILGRVEDTIFCFTDLLTFTIIEEINSSNKEQRIFKEFCPLQMVNILLYRLDGRKGAVFLGQGPVQGPREEVQGPHARATKRGARASGFSKTLNHACTSNCGPCTELHCLSLVALAHIRGPCTSFCGPCTYPSGPCTHFYLLD